MAQQVFDQYAPLAKVSANETIPVVAAIAQTRDGKDELLHGTVPFVPSGGLYVPISTANRLPVEATLSGSVAQVLDDERAAGLGQRMYYGQRVFHTLGGAGAVSIVGRTITIWFHNLGNLSTRNGIRLHWFLGGTVHDGIPTTDLPDVPAGSVLGLRIGGSAPDNDQIIHVPRFGGDGVVFSVDISSQAIGTVRTVIMEESSYA